MKTVKLFAGAVLFLGLFVSLALPDSSQSIETNQSLKDIGFCLIIFPSFVFLLDAIFKRKNVS